MKPIKILGKSILKYKIGAYAQIMRSLGANRWIILRAFIA